MTFKRALAAALAAVSLLLWQGLDPAPALATDYAVGEKRSGGVGRYRKLLDRFDDWEVWETAEPDKVSCYAIKAGTGFRHPLPPQGPGPVTGLGGGFAVRMDRPRIPGAGSRQLGFYGTWTYRISFVADVAGETLEDPDISAREFDDWDGKVARYEVTSGPYKNIYSGTKTDTGAVNFAGASEALAAVRACADQPPSERVAP